MSLEAAESRIDARKEVTREVLAKKIETARAKRELVRLMGRRGLNESHSLISVFVSVATSLDTSIKRTLEPRAAAPGQRLKTIAALHEAGVPTGALVVPVISMITGREIEHLVSSVADAGATHVNFIMLRQPHSVKILFREWLDTLTSNAPHTS